jgi:O-6-methylguanine DNA methyltransferase
MAVWSTQTLSPELKIHLAATSRGLCRLSLNKTNAEFLAELAKSLPSTQWWRDDEHPLLLQAAGQLRAWFRGELRWFDIPLDLRGTTFQKRVWRALRRIPYGETRSYKQIARQIGSPNATRAVGGANHRNPVAIIVPCHRVIAADGSLGGFGAGLEVKQLLLGIEAGNYPELAD